jgi:hypothetical protein
MNTDLPSLPAEIAKSVAHAELPTAYEAAKAALAECDRIDEIDDWADRAAALASYARQANDPELLNFANRIRARAFRKVGELLLEYDGRGRAKSGGPPIFSRGEAAGAAGISRHTALTAVRVAQVPQDQFETLVESPKPPGTTRLAEVGKISWSPRDVESPSRATVFHVRVVAPSYENCTVSEVSKNEDGYAFRILSDQRRRQLLSLAFETGDAAEKARADVAEAIAKAVTIRRSM